MSGSIRFAVRRDSLCRHITVQSGDVVTVIFENHHGSWGTRLVSQTAKEKNEMKPGTILGTFRHTGRVIRTRDSACGCKSAATKTDGPCQCTACVQRRKQTRDAKPISTLADINEQHRRAFGSR